MKHDTHLRQEIRKVFDDARVRVKEFTGLYPDEDLADEILCICDDILVRVGTSLHLNELRRDVEARCHRLADVTNRFSGRNPTVITAARKQVIVAIDQIQDAALERAAVASSQGLRSFLRRQSL